MNTYKVIKHIDFYCPQTNNHDSSTSFLIGEFEGLYEAQEARRVEMLKNRKWDLRDDRAVKYTITDSTTWPITTA